MRPLQIPNDRFLETGWLQFQTEIFRFVGKLKIVIIRSLQIDAKEAAFRVLAVHEGLPVLSCEVGEHVPVEDQFPPALSSNVHDRFEKSE
jgi:hypothetical protein